MDGRNSPTAALPTGPIRLAHLVIDTITAYEATPLAAGEVAALVRSAYAISDPLPGLPAPDGTREEPESVLRFIRGGGTFWTARDERGQLLGTLRTGFCADGALFVSRVAVAPAARGADVGRLLLAAVENHAAANDISTIRLDAVIERCVPTYYARLGYRATDHHLAEDDKLLTEVTMERDPRTAPRPAAPYRFGPPGDTPAGVLCWFLCRGGLGAVARTAPHVPASAVAGCASALDDAERLAGVDVWRGRAVEFTKFLGELPGARSRADGAVVLRFARDRADVPLHLMPRAHHRDLWAALRLPPGFEPGLDSIRNWDIEGMKAPCQ